VKFKFVFIVLALVVWTPKSSAGIILGRAKEFAILGSSTVTNTGPTIIAGGHVGVSAGTAITGFNPSGTVTSPFSLQPGTDLAAGAKTDFFLAYDAAVALTGATNLTGQDLGGQTLTPGVYSFSSSAALTGKLTLDAQLDQNAEFVFQIGSTLTTADGPGLASIEMINSGGAPMPGSNVFWQVGSSATIGTYTSFLGHILAQASITAKTGASIQWGSALAKDGAVTLDSNNITATGGAASASASVPEPSSFIALLFVGTALVVRYRVRRA
jgi:hypothetical protein